MASAEKEAPPPQWTVTVNGHARDALGTLMNQSADVPRFDVTPGEKLTIAVTITVPAHTEMTKCLLGITGDVAGIGPHGPIGMEPILATASHLTPGPYKFTLHWTVPRGGRARRRLPPGHGGVLAEGDRERATRGRAPHGRARLKVFR